MGRNIVVCLDGTRNEPERGATNVVRLFQVVARDAGQVAYYDPGVGTLGSRSAVTRIGRGLTTVTGLVMGHGVKDNIEEAYRFLMEAYEPGDRIYVFGFSRGAYTARALVGLLRTVGLLRPGTQNLVPYAMKLYTRAGTRDADPEEERAYWRTRTDFNDSFGNPDFPNRFAPQVHFLGVWDTVKSIGWLNWYGRFQQARWPFTRNVSNVAHGRHALAIDERRRFYPAYRFDPGEVAEGDRLQEVWFAGVHSDVGGTFPDDHRLADISLEWMVGQAHVHGLRVDEAAYRRVLGVPFGSPLPDDHALGTIHHNGVGWRLLGLGWSPRQPLGPGEQLHPSVRWRVDATRDSARPYAVDRGV